MSTVRFIRLVSRAYGHARQLAYRRFLDKHTTRLDERADVHAHHLMCHF